MAELPAVGSRELQAAFRRAGWTGRRGKGHTVFSLGGRTVTIDDDRKRIPAGTLAAIRRKAGLDGDTFVALLRGEWP